MIRYETPKGKEKLSILSKYITFSTWYTKSKKLSLLSLEECTK
jgi:hypothetical protein